VRKSRNKRNFVQLLTESETTEVSDKV